MPFNGGTKDVSEGHSLAPISFDTLTMRGLMAVLAAGVLVALSATPLSDSGRRTRALHPCDLPGLDRPARCAVLPVLETHGDPRGRRIDIRVVVVPSRASSQPDPVVVLAGGPGQGAAELAAPLVERLAFLAEHRDLVFIDQRGTGGSSPLVCPPPPDTADLMGRIFDPARLIACRDALSEKADLRRYTTADAAVDYEAVLDALGYHAINVWAASYGTRLALELARRVHQRVRTMTLDGVVPPSFTWPTSGAADAEAALNFVIADCERDTECAKDNPTFRRDVDAAFAALSQGRTTANVFDPFTRRNARVPFGSSDLAYATRGLLYGADALQLPTMFRAAASGRYDDFAQAYVTRARALGRELATGVHLGVYCAEDLPFVDGDTARARATATRIGAYLLDEYGRACDIWPGAPVGEGFRSPVRSSVPTLLLTGQRDPVTPPWTAHEVARTLSHARVVTWPAGGHGFDGLPSSACKHRIVGDFIATGDVDRVSLDCVPRMTSPIR